MDMYQASLGLQAGNHLTTEHGGPYRVRGISAPFYFHLLGDVLIIYHQPVVYLRLESIERYSDSHFPTLGPVGRDADGSYWSEQNDRILVETGDAVQLDMFRLTPPDPMPYAFQAGVNYDAPDGQLWHCAACGHDFNTPNDEERRIAPHCPSCDTRQLAAMIVMMRAVPRDKAKASSFQRKLGFKDEQLMKLPLEAV